MRKNIAIVAIALLGLAATAGCKKEEAGNRPSMSASVGGLAYNTNYCLATQTGALMQIDGINGVTNLVTTPYIELRMLHWTGLTGTYPIDSSQFNTAFFASDDGSYIVSEKGSIIISAIEGDVITGAFTFTGTDGTAVGNGTFTARVAPQQ